MDVFGKVDSDGTSRAFNDLFTIKDGVARAEVRDLHNYWISKLSNSDAVTSVFSNTSLTEFDNAMFQYFLRLYCGWSRHDFNNYKDLGTPSVEVGENLLRIHAIMIKLMINNVFRNRSAELFGNNTELLPCACLVD